jgi:hypothetical protein
VGARHSSNSASRRYSGNATIYLELDDAYARRQPGRQSYRYTVTTDGGDRATGYVSAPIIHGSGIAVDSSEMYDEVARSSLSFAVDDKEIDGDELEMDEEGWVVRRKPSGSKS